MIRFNVKFDDSGLRRLERNLRSLEQTRSVSFAELFTPDFMRRYTRVSSFEKLLEAGGFEVSSKEDFEAIPDDEWEKVIRANTSFASWAEMQQTAGAEFAKRRLGL